MEDTVVSVAVNGIKCIDPSVDGNEYLKEYLAKIFPVNGFKMVSGRGYSYGYFLLLRGDVDFIKTSPSNIKVKIKDGPETIDIENLLMVESWCSTPTETGPNDLMVIKLVDYRFVSMTNKTKHDIDPVPPLEKFCPPGSFLSSWESIINSYWDQSNLKTDSSNLSNNTDYPSVLIRDVQTKHSGSAWETLNDILDSISHRVFQTKDGYSIKKDSYLSTPLSQRTDGEAGRKLMGRELTKQQDQSEKIPFLPKKIKVRFRQLEGDFHHNNYVNDLIVEKDHSGDGTTLSTNTLDIPFWNIYDQASSDSSYYDDLQTLGEEIADRYFDSFDNHNKFNKSYFGAINIEHCPEANEIIWYHDLDDGAYKTKVKSIDLKNRSWPCIEDIDSTSDCYLICPPKGFMIPPMVDGVPGVKTGCCLFVIDKDSGAVSQVVDKDGKPIRATVYNIHEVFIPYNYHEAKRLKSGQLIVSYPHVDAIEGDLGTTTTTFNPTATTTLVPGGVYESDCIGFCEMVYSLTTNRWSVYSNQCSETTTTTTTSTTTTSTTPDPSTTTTTTTADPFCICSEEPTTTTTTADPSTTTTTTTGDPSTTTTTTTGIPVCECSFPTFCGDSSETRTFTQCSTIPNPHPNCDCVCTTTSTTTTSFDPNEPLPDDCEGQCIGCEWIFIAGGYNLIRRCCFGEGCSSCSPPTASGSPVSCDTVITPCRVQDTPVGVCTGGCTWFALPDSNGWVLINNSCSLSIAACECEIPSQVDSCVFAMTSCRVPGTTVDPSIHCDIFCATSSTTPDPGTTTTSTTSTTTTTPDPSTTTTTTTPVPGEVACCNTTTGVCFDVEDSVLGTFNCVNQGGEVFEGMTCEELFNSNQACTATTTTTPNPCLTECGWRWTPLTTTTTTEDPSTTTTLPPCTGGTCLWEALSINQEGNFTWTLTSGCTTPCDCPPPSSEPSGAGDTANTDCSLLPYATPNNRGADRPSGFWTQLFGCSNPTPGQDNPCICEQPDFDGQFLNQETRTDCDGFVLSGFNEIQDAPLTGACCDSLFSSCVEVTLEECAAYKGTYRGDGTGCSDPGICDPITTSPEPNCQGNCIATCNGQFYVISSSNCIEHSGDPCMCALGFIPCENSGETIGIACIQSGTLIPT